MNNLILLTLKKVLNKHRWLIAGLIVLIILTVSLSLIPPQLMRILIDQHLVSKQNEGIIHLALLYLVCLLMIALIDFLKSSLLTFLGVKISLEYRYEMLLKLERIAPMYFTKQTPAGVTSRFINDINSLYELFSEGLISMIIDCLKIVGILISIYFFAWQLSLITLLLIPLIFFITQLFRKNMLLAQRNNLEQLSHVNQQISDTLTNIKMIKLYNKEVYMEELYKQCLISNFIVKEKVNFYDSLYAPTIQIIRAIVIGCVVLLSATELNLIGITLGMLAASIDLISNLLSPIESLGLEINNIQKGLSGIIRVNEFFNEAEETLKDNDLTYDVVLKNGVENIMFDHVSFEYVQHQKVLKNISFTIHSGSKITFTGRSGVGKTTLFNLIMGLYEPTLGNVTLNSYPLTKIPHHEKRKIFGYVEQQFSFIRGTIFDQISLKDPQITLDQVIDACKKAQLHEAIMNFPKGYSTIITSGTEFSQGQKQLLSIARAIVNNPPILLLDEITANLDTATETKINAVLKEAVQGRTILSISHRLSSILGDEEQIHIENGELLINHKL